MEVKRGNNKFEWSLGPIIFFMKMLGVPMDMFKESPQYYVSHLMIAIIGWAILFSNLTINGLSFVENFWSNLNNKNQRTTSFLNNVGGHFAHVFMVMGTHISFMILFFMSGRWKEIWAALSNIQKEMSLSEIFHRKCRCHCFFALLLLLLDTIGFIYQSLDSSYWKTISSIEEPVAIVLGNLSHMVAISIQTVFFILTHAATSLFRELNSRMEAISSPDFDHSRLSIELEKWRSHHNLVCRLVELINRCFSLIMLITLCHGCVSFGQCTSLLVLNYKERKSFAGWDFCLFILIQLFSRLLVVVVGSYRIQSHSWKLGGVLRRVRSSCNPQMQLQFNTVLLQVTHARPKITAMHFVEVDLTIIPTVIGTTLTYAVIIYQSH